MSIPTLPPARRSELRADAHALKPVVLIGESGLTPAVLREIDCHLVAHTLIKVRIFADDRQVRLAVSQEICERLQAALVQQIGKMLVLYRYGETVLESPLGKSPLSPALTKRASLAAPPRTVLARKPPSRPGQRPKAKKIQLLGNERLTPGGNVKRAKIRQASSKKRALS